MFFVLGDQLDTNDSNFHLVYDNIRTYTKVNLSQQQSYPATQTSNFVKVITY